MSSPSRCPGGPDATTIPMQLHSDPMTTECNNGESGTHQGAQVLLAQSQVVAPQVVQTTTTTPAPPFISALSNSDEVPLVSSKATGITIYQPAPSHQFHIASINMPGSPSSSALRRTWTLSSSASNSQANLSPDLPQETPRGDGKGDQGTEAPTLPPVSPTPVAVTVVSPLTGPDAPATKPLTLLALRRRSSVAAHKRPAPPVTTSSFRSTTPRLASPSIGSTPRTLGPGSYTARPHSGAADLHAPWVLAVQFRLGRALTPAASSVFTFSGCGHDDGGFAEAQHAGDAWGKLTHDTSVPPNVLLTQRAMGSKPPTPPQRPVSPRPASAGTGRPPTRASASASLAKQAIVRGAAASTSAGAVLAQSLTQAGHGALPDVRRTLDGRAVFSEAFFTPRVPGVRSPAGSRRGSRRESVSSVGPPPPAKSTGPKIAFAQPVYLSPKLAAPLGGGTATVAARRKSSVSQVAGLLLQQRKQAGSLLETIAG